MFTYGPKNIYHGGRMTFHHLRQIYENVGKKLCSLMDLRTFTMVVVSFAGFLRYNEIAELRRSVLENLS